MLVKDDPDYLIDSEAVSSNPFLDTKKKLPVLTNSDIGEDDDLANLIVSDNELIEVELNSNIQSAASLLEQNPIDIVTNHEDFIENTLMPMANFIFKLQSLARNLIVRWQSLAKSWASEVVFEVQCPAKDPVSSTPKSKSAVTASKN
ncbi:hypothetical protein C0995_002681, partial [Termitomyces sp. Mi166